MRSVLILLLVLGSAGCKSKTVGDLEARVEALEAWKATQTREYTELEERVVQLEELEKRRAERRARMRKHRRERAAGGPDTDESATE